MVWNLASLDEKVSMKVDASGRGPVTGTLTHLGLTYHVTGGWSASGSVPGRNASAFSISGSAPTSPHVPSWIAASGTMIGPGAKPKSVALRMSVSSSATGAIERYIGTLYSLDGVALANAATACRVSNLDASECAPVLYAQFPTTSLDDLTVVLVSTWSCELSADALSAALTSCTTAGGAPAFQPADIAAAVANNLSLTYIDHLGIGGKRINEIGLSQGNLATMTSAESVDYLVISTLPGDYAPASGTLVGALAAAGVSVADLATDKAADYLSTNHCWVSKPIPNQAFGRIICFESTGAEAVADVPGVFASLRAFLPNPPPSPNSGPTIASSLLSTGQAGAPRNEMLTAMFRGAYDLVQSGYNLMCFKIDIFDPAWSAGLKTVFDQLKQQP